MEDEKIVRYSDHLIIRKSTAILLIRLITFEFFAGVVYILFRLALRFIDIQLDTELSLDPLSLIKSFFFMFIELSVGGYVILKWINDYYILTPYEIKIASGILSKKEMNFSIKNLQSVSYDQGLLGRIFNFGNVKAFSPALQKELFLTEVSSPKHLVENIKDVPEEAGNKAQFIIRR